MRLLSARLIVSLILGVTLVSLLSSYIEVRGERRRLRRDLERRAEVLGESLAGNVEPYLQRQSPRELERIVERFSHREQLAPGPHQDRLLLGSNNAPMSSAHRSCGAKNGDEKRPCFPFSFKVLLPSTNFDPNHSMTGGYF